MSIIGVSTIEFFEGVSIIRVFYYRGLLSGYLLYVMSIKGDVYCGVV